MPASDPSDRLLVEHLRRHGGAAIADLTDLLGVTATAVRQRLGRLTAAGLVERVAQRPDGDAPRGRPRHRYQLTERGRREAGDNYHDLVQVLWQEVRAIREPEVRTGLVRRLAAKLAGRYAGRVAGGDLAERMRELIGLMGEREVPVEVNESEGRPVLQVLACPYPTLAEQDRSVCAMEKAMFSEVLGEGVRLSACRLDGGSCCTFEPSKGAAVADEVAPPATAAATQSGEADLGVASRVG